MTTHDRSCWTSASGLLLAAALGLGMLTPLSAAQDERRTEERQERAERRQERAEHRNERQDEHRRQREHQRELEEILHGLEMGMHALERLDRRDALGGLRRIADEVRDEMRQDRDQDRDQERHRREGDRDRGSDDHRGQREALATMSTAIPALREADRADLARMIEHAIRARELELEGRDDPESMEIRRSAPSLGNQAEILGLASRLWMDFGHESKAAALAQLARRMGAAARAERERAEPRATDRRPERDRPRETDRRPDRDRPRETDRLPERDHEIRETMETLEIALHGLLEAERAEAADAMERILRAYRVHVEGRTDAEARRIQEAMPGVEAQIELLRMAARIWAEFGHERRAERIAALADRIVERERGRRKARDRAPDRRGEVERLEAQMAELRAAMERMAGELERLRGRGDR